MPLRSVVPGPKERDESRARSGARLLVNRCDETVERRTRKEERGCDITHAVVHSQKGAHYIALAWSEAVCPAEALEGLLKRESGWRCRCRLARARVVLLRHILGIDVGSGVLAWVLASDLLSSRAREKRCSDACEQDDCGNYHAKRVAVVDQGNSRRAHEHRADVVEHTAHAFSYEQRVSYRSW